MTKSFPLAILAFLCAGAVFAGDISFDQPLDVKAVLEGVGGRPLPRPVLAGTHLGWTSDCKDVQMRQGEAMSRKLELVSFEIVEECDTPQTPPHCHRTFGESVRKDTRLIMVNRPADRPSEAFKVCLTGHDLTVDTFGSQFPYDVSIRGDDVVLRAR